MAVRARAVSAPVASRKARRASSILPSSSMATTAFSRRSVAVRSGCVCGVSVGRGRWPPWCAIGAPHRWQKAKPGTCCLPHDGHLSEWEFTLSLGNEGGPRRPAILRQIPLELQVPVARLLRKRNGAAMPLTRQQREKSNALACRQIVVGRGIERVERRSACGASGLRGIPQAWWNRVMMSQASCGVSA